MKKVVSVRFSLRKLFIAMLAIGPLAVVPSPLWAVVPTSAAYTVTNGSVTLSGAGTTSGTFNASDRSILVWGAGNFNVASGDTWSFQLPSGGAVLNKVGYNTNGTLAATDTATITGSLTSNGKVFVLANGGINVATGAQISTTGGLVLSTLQESSDFSFTTTGNLTFSGSSLGTIALAGTGATAVGVTGNFAAYAGTVTTGNLSVSGDVLVNQTTSGVAYQPATKISAGGNLTIATNNGVIGNNATGTLTSANVTTLSSGTAAINLDNVANDFGTLSVNTSGTGGTVTVTDANIVTLGASSVGGDLIVRVGGKTNTTGIGTSGAVAVTGNVQLLSASSANSAVNFASGSSIGGTVSAITSGGAITINTTGNLTVGNLTNSLTPRVLTGLIGTPAAGTYTAATVTSGAPASGVVSTATVATGLASPLYTGNVSLTFQSPIASATSPAPVANAIPTGSLGAGSGTSPAAGTFLGGGNYTGSASSDYTVVISGGGGTGATATVTVAGDVVTGINITAGGAGYTSSPTITIVPVTATGTAHDTAAVLPVAVATLNGTTGFLDAAVAFTSNGTGYGSLTPNVTFTAPVYTTAGVTVTSTGNIVTSGTNSRGVDLNNAALTAGIQTGRAATITGANVTLGAVVTSANASSGGAVSVNATAGNAALNGAITGSSVAIRATGGNITQSAIITTANATATNTFNATGSSVTLDQNNVFANNSIIQLTGNNVLLTGATNSITVGTSNVTGNLTIAAATAAKNVTLGTGTGVGVGQNITVGGNLTITTSTTGTIVDNDYSAINVLGTANLTSGSGAITLDAATGVAAASARYGQFNVNTTGAVTLAESTTVNLGNVGNTAIPSSLAVTSVTGGVIDSGNIIVSGTANFTVSGNNTVVLDSGGSVIPTLNVIGGGENSVTALNGNVILGSSTTIPANLTIGTNNGFGVSLSNFTAAGNLTVNSGAWIDIKDNAAITGNLALNATGNFPAVNLLPASFVYNNVMNSTATIALGANVTAVSLANLPVLTFTTAPTVAINGGTFTTQATAVANLDSFGQITNLTITSPATSGYTVAPTSVTYTGGSSNTSITESGGSLSVGGTTTINSAGNAQLFRANDFTGSVVLNNMTGGGTINDVNNLTISGLSTGAVTARAGTNGGTITTAMATPGGTAPALVSNAWNLSLANLNVNALTAVASNGGGGNSGTITQTSGATLHVDNLGSFTTTNGTITLTNANNSVGPVVLSSGSGTISYTEGATVKLRTLSSSGNATITASTGSIIEDTTANTTIGGNFVTLNATNGSISLGGTTQNGTFTTAGSTANITATAPSGSVALISSAGNYSLGAIKANSLTVSAGANLVQSAALSVFGAANFTAAGNVTLTNSANNFGPIIINSTGANKNVSITEQGTLNLRTVAMAAGTTGNFTATSTAGDIISTGFGGVRAGGTIASPGSGVVTLVASAGNITVGDATTDFPTTGGVVFNGNNVSLTVLGGTGGTTPIVLGANGTASVATGNLTVSSATGSILNAGNLTVTGNASFTTGIGNISLNQSGDSFGNLKFVGNQVSVIQANNMNILTGSSALGAATLGSSGSIGIVNVGGQVSFGSTVSLSATGNITLPKLIQAAGTITVNAAGTKDLSALSITGDLAGKTPVNLGTGAYSGPQP